MTMQFRCEDAGVACKAVTRAETKDELLAAVSQHARDEHGVELNDTLVDYALTTVTADHRAE
jgi:predicted small metal-binding protein